MDFTLSADQRELVGLAEKILTDRVDPARLTHIEAGIEGIDRELWQVLADTGLLGIGLPVELGGSDTGFLEMCLLLEQLGRRVAPVPLWPTLVLGARAVLEFGTHRQRQRWLPQVSAGTAILTGALNGVDPRAGCGPITGRVDGAGLRIQGRAMSVPAAHVAARIVLPVHLGGVDWRLVLLDPDSPGVHRVSAVTTDRQVHQHLHLDDVPIYADDIMLTPPGSVDRLLQLAQAGLCALQVGVIDEAIALTTAHIVTRTQFGRPIASFQAVVMRCADAYIDLQAMRLTMLHAAWLLDAGQPAPAEVAVAKWWACTAGLRTVHSALHLHGGIGNDVEYPLHRYFLWSRQIGLTLGGAAEQLATLSRMVATLDPTGASPVPDPR
jgi:alkylation response protein AidB-like acyl-CoA dehydrogenase